MEQAPRELDELCGNTLLAALPEVEFDRLSRCLEVVDVQLRDGVYRPRQPISEVYFPLTAVFSMVAAADDRLTVEVGTVGYEGMVGLPLFLGASTSPNAAFCQIPGRAVRLGAADLHEFLGHDGALHRVLQRFTQTTMVQLAQNVACNMTHAIEQRAARWLLATGDRVGSDQFMLTHEFLGQMLGVRRPTTSATASKLQADGLIRYSRGKVGIVDRSGLTERACECYHILNAEFETFTSDL